MDKAIKQAVRDRADSACEYCKLPETASKLWFTIDHITPRQHGGESDMRNLALACGFCNRHKGPNLTGIDPVTRQIVSLYNPRIDHWKDHFAWLDARIVGVSPKGRATVAVLSRNHPHQLIARHVLLLEGRLLTDDEV